MSLFRPLNVALSLLCLGISACVTTPMPLEHRPVDYDARPMLRMDVAELMVLNDASTTPLTAELAGKFGPSPEEALNEWLNRRIQAVGPQGSFTVIIRDANFTATKLPVESGMQSYFKRQQAVRWDAFLNVIIAVEGGAHGQPPAELTINVRASQTMGENPSAEEKRLTYNSILNKLMTMFDAEAQKRMDAYFRAYYQ